MSSALNVLVFDIETVPDVAAGRRLYGLDGLEDEDVARAMGHLRRQETGESDFLRLPLHRIVAISAVLRRGDQLTVWSLGEVAAGERELIQRFFDGIEKYVPVLVSWNGSGFDLPVLHYRALLHGVSAPRYWDTGDGDRDFRWNNYLSRYHWRHLDLMDLLSAFQPRAVAPLDQVAALLGFPGKTGMDGGQVWARFLAGDLAAIRHYCEADVLNTYLVFLRFELLRGTLTREAHEAECQRLEALLTADARPHLQAFLAAWREARAGLAHLG